MPQFPLRQFFILSKPSPLDKKEVLWILTDLFKVVGVYFATLVLLTLLGPRPDTLTDKVLVYIVASQTAAAVLALFWFYKRGLWPGLEYFQIKIRHFRMHFLTGVSWGFICKVVPSLLMLLLIVMFPGASRNNNFLRGLDFMSTTWLVMALDVVIAVPLVEEVFFRGLLYGLLREKLGIWMAIVVSSALFGMGHGLGPVGLVTALAGVGFALVYEKTGSLAPAVIAHSLGNLLAVSLTFWG